MIYCVDTSGWLDGWVRDYPRDVFPSMWEEIEKLVAEGQIGSTEEVYTEVAKKGDSLHDWIKQRKEMLYPIDEGVQEIVSEILVDHPRLVDTLKGRSQADPFVIATAEHLDAIVVTGERASGNMDKPKIPDVCSARGVECITFLDMLRELGWRF